MLLSLLLLCVVVVVDIDVLLLSLLFVCVCVCVCGAFPSTSANCCCGRRGLVAAVAPLAPISSLTPRNPVWIEARTRGLASVQYAPNASESSMD